MRTAEFGADLQVCTIVLMEPDVGIELLYIVVRGGDRNGRKTKFITERGFALYLGDNDIVRDLPAEDAVIFHFDCTGNETLTTEFAEIGAANIKLDDSLCNSQNESLSL